MIPDFFHSSLWGEALLFLAITALSFVVSQVMVFLFRKVLKALTARTSTTLDDLLIEALRRPLFLFILVIGLYGALTTVNFLDPFQKVINRALLATDMALAVYASNRVLHALLTWYKKEIAPRTQSTIDARLLPLGQRVATGVIYLIGGLMVFRAVGLDISPLLAGLGIGGLAVALALQPTLNNLIAGAYTVSESKIGVGDYVRLEDGQRPEGVVEDIGWRTTKIRTPQNNIVVIPNAKLADSVVTNFGAPNPEMVTVVACGVSYESDLERVQRITQEVARGVLLHTPGAVADSQPMVRFRKFGDSNIYFEVLLRVQNYMGQFAVTSAFIKELHQRFRQEGIQIDYPVRRLIYPTGDSGPQTVLGVERTLGQLPPG